MSIDSQYSKFEFLGFCYLSFRNEVLRENGQQKKDSLLNHVNVVIENIDCFDLKSKSIHIRKKSEVDMTFTESHILAR